MSLPSDPHFLTFYFPLASVPSYCLFFFPSFRLSIFPSFLVSLFIPSPLSFFPPCPSFLISAFPFPLRLLPCLLLTLFLHSFVPVSSFHLSSFRLPSPSSFFLSFYHTSSLLLDSTHAFSPRSNTLRFPSFLPPFRPLPLTSLQNKIKQKKHTSTPRSLEASKCLGGIREAITINQLINQFIN